MQSTLFELPPADPKPARKRPEATRLCRRGQPTSRAAAGALVESGDHARQQLAVLAALAAHPGSTSRQLAERANLDRYTVARRLPDLERNGRARKGEKVRDDNGRLAVTWFPVEWSDSA